MKKIYFITDKGIKSHEDKSIKNSRELILKYYDMEQPETFYLDGKPQCTYSKQRSFMDIYILCKTRFPKTTKNIVARKLVNLCKQELLKCQYCGTIHTVVFHRIYNNWTYISKNSIETYSTTGDKYSINAIFELSKIK